MRAGTRSPTPRSTGSWRRTRRAICTLPITPTSTTRRAVYALGDRFRAVRPGRRPRAPTPCSTSTATPAVRSSCSRCARGSAPRPSRASSGLGRPIAAVGIDRRLHRARVAGLRPGPRRVPRRVAVRHDTPPMPGHPDWTVDPVEPPAPALRSLQAGGACAADRGARAADRRSGPRRRTAGGGGGEYKQDVDPQIADGSAQRALDAARARWARPGSAPTTSASRCCASAPRTCASRGCCACAADGRSAPARRGTCARSATVPRMHKVVQAAIDARVDALDVRYGQRGLPRAASTSTRAAGSPTTSTASRPTASDEPR